MALCKDGANEELRKCDKIHIFLAGNSSKSEILRELFKENIERWTEVFRKACISHGTELDEEEEYFKLYYPLGTPEADEQMPEKADGDSERPTGKTGVAIGLVESRKGSRIKVISSAEDQETQDPRFLYWVGYDEDDYFKYVLHRDSAYGEWVEYLDAGEEYFEFSYTTAPSAEMEQSLPINDSMVKVKRLKIPESAVNEDAVIYLRPVSPNELEYVVAADEAAVAAGEYDCKPERVVLK